MASTDLQFSTIFTGSVGPRCSVSLRKYSNGSYKVCFFQTIFKRASRNTTERYVYLSSKAWERFLDVLCEIDRGISVLMDGGVYDLDQDLGDDIRVCMTTTYPFVNIRKYWQPPGKDEKVATSIGVCIKFQDYWELKKLIPVIKSLLPERKGSTCSGHQNYLAALQCPTCNPAYS